MCLLRHKTVNMQTRKGIRFDSYDVNVEYIKYLDYNTSGRQMFLIFGVRL